MLTRNTVQFVKERIILFHHVPKHTEVMMIRERPMRDQNLLKNLVYKFSVPILLTDQTELMTEQMTTTTDNVFEVHHETAIIEKNSHNTDTALHHEIEITMTKVLLRNIILVHDMIIIKRLSIVSFS